MFVSQKSCRPTCYVIVSAQLLAWPHQRGSDDACCRTDAPVVGAVQSGQSGAACNSFPGVVSRRRLCRNFGPPAGQTGGRTDFALVLDDKLSRERGVQHPNRSDDERRATSGRRAATDSGTWWLCNRYTDTSQLLSPFRASYSLSVRVSVTVSVGRRYDL